MLVVKKAGLQTTLQGAPRTGLRHLGFPYSGPAGFSATAEKDCTIAITGAVGAITQSGAKKNPHRTIQLAQGDDLVIDAPTFGVRAYLAISSGFVATKQFGSTSTYLPAKVGGLDGRAVQDEDVLYSSAPAHFEELLQTPPELQLRFTNGFAFRTCESVETKRLNRSSKAALFEKTFIAGRQATRMGVTLTGPHLRASGDGQMKSVPVFPGIVQCPPSGEPIVLLCDAQTTGGYPRIASIARCDRHLLGQVRPGNTLQLLKRTPPQAVEAFKAKQKHLESWLISEPRDKPIAHAMI